VPPIAHEEEESRIAFAEDLRLLLAKDDLV
jgi:hypothetical protein